MPPVACLDCRTITTRPRKGRCAGCYLASQRKYGPDHRKARSEWQPYVATGVIRCSRCGERIAPGAAWDLDHRVGHSAPSHASCNRAAKGTP